MVASNQLFPEIWHNWMMDMVRNGPKPDMAQPYQYSPGAIERIRKRVARKGEQ
jgi:hypothetical protein